VAYQFRSPFAAAYADYQTEATAPSGLHPDECILEQNATARCCI
jgi:hypothetical protein